MKNIMKYTKVLEEIDRLIIHYKQQENKATREDEFNFYLGCRHSLEYLTHKIYKNEFHHKPKEKPSKENPE